MSERKYVFSVGSVCPPSWQPRYWCNCRASDSIRYQVIWYRWQRDMTRDKGALRAKSAKHKQSRVATGARLPGEEKGKWTKLSYRANISLIRSPTFSQRPSIPYWSLITILSLVPRFSTRWTSHLILWYWILWRIGYSTVSLRWLLSLLQMKSIVLKGLCVPYLDKPPIRQVTLKSLSLISL